jgi:hypothetical protein
MSDVWHSRKMKVNSSDRANIVEASPTGAEEAAFSEASLESGKCTASVVHVRLLGRRIKHVTYPAAWSDSFSDMQRATHRREPNGLELLA